MKLKKNQDRSNRKSFNNMISLSKQELTKIKGGRGGHFEYINGEWVWVPD